jgi:SAM-dependent methyltransferase
LKNPITSQYTDGSYLEKVKDWHASDAPWKAKKIILMLEKHQISPKAVYDIGCGAGEILVELQRHMGRDIVFRGYDISPQGIDICRPKENRTLKFFNQDFLLTEMDPCDLLLLLDVFEHIPDYIGFLEKLREKSFLFLFHIPLDISVQAIKRKSSIMLEMRTQYGHLHYFTKETALSTLSDTGFEVIDYFYTDDRETMRPPKTVRHRLVYEVRKWLYKLNPDFSAFMFASYNLMVLARRAR